MTKEALKSNLRGWLQKAEKYKFAVLILLVGIVLMVLPTGSEKDAAEKEITTQEELDDLEVRLESLLSQIEGAGEVRVLLSLETSPSVTYQEDVQKNSAGEEQEIKKETVLVSEDGNDVPVVVKTTYPIYKGAVVVCQGADSAAVKLSIVRAVSSVTGLGSDKITIVRMKGN